MKIYITFGSKHNYNIKKQERLRSNCLVEGSVLRTQSMMEVNGEMFLLN